MGQKIAIDFGTTNSVIARWNTEKDDAEQLEVKSVSDITVPDRPPIVPSLLYVDDANTGTFTIGQAVREQSKDEKKTIASFAISSVALLQHLHLNLVTLMVNNLQTVMQGAVLKADS